MPPPGLAVTKSAPPEEIPAAIQEKLAALNSSILHSVTLEPAGRDADGSISLDAEWPVVPFRVKISRYPDIDFIITEVVPIGTLRERGWQSVAIESLAPEIEYASIPGPVQFAAGEDDISIVRVTERPLSKGLRDIRPAMALGLRMLNTRISKLPPAQITGVFRSTTVQERVVATLETLFSSMVPPIPDQWVIWPTELLTPPAAGKKLLVISSLPFGDGWDLKHVAHLLQSTLDQLWPFKSSGQTEPITVETSTSAKDWSFSNSFDGYARRYTLDMQIVLLTFLRHLVLLHGLSVLQYSLIDEEKDEIAGGSFRFMYKVGEYTTSLPMALSSSPNPFHKMEPSPTAILL